MAGGFVIFSVSDCHPARATDTTRKIASHLDPKSSVSPLRGFNLKPGSDSQSENTGSTPVGGTFYFANTAPFKTFTKASQVSDGAPGVRQLGPAIVAR